MSNATRSGLSTGQTKNPGIAHEFYRGFLSTPSVTRGNYFLQGFIYSCFYNKKKGVVALPGVTYAATLSGALLRLITLPFKI